MELPGDIERYFRRTFVAAEWATVAALLANAVIAEGEYMPRAGQLVRVRDLNDPILDGDVPPRP